MRCPFSRPLLTFFAKKQQKIVTPPRECKGECVEILKKIDITAFFWGFFIEKTAWALDFLVFLKNFLGCTFLHAPFFFDQKMVKKHVSNGRKSGFWA